MAKGHTKGSAFEREVCKQLSLWWTEGERDDVFWRTDNSGGRATTRAKAAQETFGQYGDVQATDPIGQPLMDYAVIELKRGYNHVTPYDALDVPEGRAVPEFLEWWHKAEEDRKNAGARSRWVVTKRDRRDVILHMSIHDRSELIDYFGRFPGPSLRLTYGTCCCWSMDLRDFFEWVDPRFFIDRLWTPLA